MVRCQQEEKPTRSTDKCQQQNPNRIKPIHSSNLPRYCVLADTLVQNLIIMKLKPSFIAVSWRYIISFNNLKSSLIRPNPSQPGQLFIIRHPFGGE